MYGEILFEVIHHYSADEINVETLILRLKREISHLILSKCYLRTKLHLCKNMNIAVFSFNKLLFF